MDILSLINAFLFGKKKKRSNGGILNQSNSRTMSLFLSIYFITLYYEYTPYLAGVSPIIVPPRKKRGGGVFLRLPFLDCSLWGWFAKYDWLYFYKYQYTFQIG